MKIEFLIWFVFFHSIESISHIKSLKNINVNAQFEQESVKFAIEHPDADVPLFTKKWLRNNAASSKDLVDQPAIEIEPVCFFTH